MRWDSRKTDTPWKSWSTFPRHVIQTTINTKTNSEHTLSHLLSTQKNANTEGQNVVASTSKLWYSSHQAAFSIRRTLNPWWGWRADLSVPVPLNEAEGKTFPPCAAYHNLPSMQLTQLSKRNKGLVWPSSTTVQAHRRQSRPCASSGHPNTPELISQNGDDGRNFPSAPWLQHRTSVFILSDSIYTGTLVAPPGQCSTSASLHSTAFAYMGPRKVHRTRGWWKKPGEEVFPGQNRGYFRKV